MWQRESVEKGKYIVRKAGGIDKREVGIVAELEKRRERDRRVSELVDCLNLVLTANYHHISLESYKYFAGNDLK